ncbi:hypothetical protein SAMN06265367_103300 [Algoriphagus winogradskyi]|uniref:Uncharacterized protein n=1 Tax=Algoriphagus winogradskyi TaxID=237017 RepID=A0ABY1NYP5_9BACT|nr:hypothetical protein SAMN06265367_103300 [Algoriphagus winogradskyi]
METIIKAFNIYIVSAFSNYQIFWKQATFNVIEARFNLPILLSFR